MLKIAGEIKQASHAARCQRRLDRCRCLQEGVLYATLLEYLALVHMLIALLQLLAYYLHMPSEALVWRGLRGVFYASYLLSSLLLLMFLALNGLWLLLASLLHPVKAAPHAVAMIGVICCGVRYAARLAYIRTRVLHDLHGRLASSHSLCSEVAQTLPPSLLKLLLDKNLDAVMSDNDLSRWKLFLRLFKYLAGLVCIQILLFIAFQV